MNEFTQAQINALAERTADAYYASNYGKHWRPIIRWLGEKGWSEQEVEAIVRSKYMRWANDHSGRCTIKGFQSFYVLADERWHYFSNTAIDELVDQTFPPTEEEKEARRAARSDRMVAQSTATLERLQAKARAEWRAIRGHFK
jgi:hypothetical protein